MKQTQALIHAVLAGLAIFNLPVTTKTALYQHQGDPPPAEQIELGQLTQLYLAQKLQS